MLPLSLVMIVGIGTFLLIVFVAGAVVGATIVWNWHRSTMLDVRLEEERRQKAGT